MSNRADRINYQSLLADALFELKELRSQLDALESAKTEPIAIIGMGCRFPGGATSPAAFWRLLEQGVDAISEIPPERWNIDLLYDPHPDKAGKIATRWGSFVEQIDQFDPAFFGISPREAAAMDPQQRLILEVAWEALEYAGQPADRISGSDTGVFVGVYTNDFEQIQYSDLTHVDAYSCTGGACDIIAGRLAYLLNLQGPCMIINTACSSSLVAVHLACQSLRNGECTMALAGGVNILLSPERYAGASRMHMMAADGRCKTFDARADGFVRGEGCGVIVLKRLSDALKDNDTILALIRGSAVNQDGRSASMTAPNCLAQQAVLRQALASAGVQPQEVGYIETHGTGTALGDPIEVEALAEVYGRARPASQPCVLGAVKTNLGHLESAAGIAGVLKIVLALQHQAIPANLHFQTLNPHISLEHTPFVVPTELYAWPQGDTPRYAGASSYGWSGTNAHVILQEAPPATATPVAPERTYLLPLSARSAGALHELARATAALLREGDAPALGDLCYTAGRRRTHHDYRLAVAGATAADLAAQLDALSPDSFSAVTELAPPLVLVFSGYGGQWPGMARQLLAEQPVFRQAIEACAAAFAPYVNWSLLELLERETPLSIDNQSERIQPVLFAMAVGLHALWRSWGVRPAAVIGHSLGEIAAAYAAGILPLATAARMVCRRGQVMQAVSGLGGMLLVELTLVEVEASLARYDGRLTLAVINSERSLVVAGDLEALAELEAELNAQAIFCRRVQIDVASHSPQMDRLLPGWRAALAGVEPQVGQVPLYSTVEGRLLEGRKLDAGYWARNLRAPVRFEAALTQALQDGYRLFVEVSAHPVLLPSVTATLRANGLEGTVLPSLRRATDPQHSLHETLAALYRLGVPLDWSTLAPTGRCVALPTYPWQRARYWSQPDSAGPIQHLTARPASGHPLLGQRFSPAAQPNTHYWESEIGPSLLAYLAEHQVQDLIVLPGVAYLELALAGARDLFGPGRHALAQVAFTQMLSFAPDEIRTLQLQIVEQGAGAAEFTIFSRPVGATDADWIAHAQGRIQPGAGEAPPARLAREAIQGRCAELLGSAAYYEQLVGQGMHYGPAFQGVAEIWRRDTEALGRLEPTAPVRRDGHRYLLHPALLDACFQAVGALLPQFDPSETGSSTYLPVGVRELQIYQAPDPNSELWVHTQLRQDDNGSLETIESDLALFDSDGQPLLSACGLRVQQLRSAQRTAQRNPIDEWLYSIRWEQADIQPEQSAPPASWLLLASRGSLGEQVAERLTARGDICITAFAGSTYQAIAPGRYELNPKDPESFLRLLKQAFGADTPACRGVIHLWGLEESAACGEETTLAALATAQELGCESALALTQALARAGWPTSPRIWLVTRGTQAVGIPPLVLEVAQTPLWGLGKTIIHEYPELRCTSVDLSLPAPADEAQVLLDTIWADDPETQVALRPDARYVARMVRYQREVQVDDEAGARVPAGDQPFRLEIARPGVLDRLILRGVERRAPGPGEVEIRVEAAGLNFIDVLRVMGTYPGQENGPVVPGGECAGVITAVGPDVEGFTVGDPVIACAQGSFSSFVVTPAGFVTHKPANLSFEEAAGLPTIFMTVYFGLHQLAQLAPGERILIHSAASGTGLAAVQYAQHVGAEIFATAGTPQKRAFLQSLGVQHVMDSRTLAFADEVMELTNGAGVDVVLNSLSGAAIPKSMSTLGMYGRFVELGKKDIYQNGHLDLSPFRNSLSYFAVDLVGMRAVKPALFGSLLREVTRMFADGTFRPQPVQTFPISDAANAFHTMAQGRHIGKLVVSMQNREQALIVPARRSEAALRPDGTYLISGGLGGIGLQLAQWFADQGARHLALLGRNGPSAEAQATLDALTARGVTARVFPADVSEPAALAGVLEAIQSSMPPVRGVAHAAAVLDDGVLLHLTPERFARVFAPKVIGAWNLHLQTQQQPLDFFVLFSSAAALLGSPGQANYTAANAFLDALAHYRRARGLPGLSINWGPWAEGGMAAAHANRGERLAHQGISSIPPAAGLTALGWLLRQEVAQVAVLPLNLRQWRQSYPKVAQNPLFTNLLREQEQNATHRQSQSPLRAALAAAKPSERRVLLEAHVNELVTSVLRLPAGRIDRQAPFGSFGLDSLMALELRNRLEDSLGLNFQVTLIWNYQTVAALSTHLAEKLQLPLEEVQEEKTESAFTLEQSAELAALLREIDKLSLDELQQNIIVDF